MFWSLLKTGKYLVWDLPGSAIASCCRRRPSPSPSDDDARRRQLAHLRDSTILREAAASREGAAGPARRRRRPERLGSQSADTTRLRALLDDAKEVKGSTAISVRDVLGRGAWHFLLGATDSIKTTSVMMFCLVLIMEKEGVDPETFDAVLNEALNILIYLGLGGALTGVFFENTHHTDWILETLEQSAAWIYLLLQDLPGGFILSIAIAGVLSVLTALNIYDPDNGLTLLDKAGGNRVITVHAGIEDDPSGNGGCPMQTWRAASRLYKASSITVLNYFLVRWFAFYAGDTDRNSPISLGLGVGWGALALARTLAELGFGTARSAADLQQSWLFKLANYASSASQLVITFTQVLEFLPHFIVWTAKNWLKDTPPEIDLLKFSVWSVLTYGVATLAAAIAANDTFQLGEMLFRFTAAREVVHVSDEEAVPDEDELLVAIQQVHKGIEEQPREREASLYGVFAKMFTAPAVRIGDAEGVETVLATRSFGR